MQNYIEAFYTRISLFVWFILSPEFTFHTHLFPQLLQCDGNLYDAMSIAIKAALFNTK